MYEVNLVSCQSGITDEYNEVCDDDAADREHTKDGKYVKRLLVEVEFVCMVTQDKDAKSQNASNGKT